MFFKRSIRPVGLLLGVVLLSACSGGNGSGTLPSKATTDAPESAFAHANRTTLREFLYARSRGTSGYHGNVDGWIDPESTAAFKRGVLYVSDIPDFSQLGAPGTVNIYDGPSTNLRARLIGQITGLDSPTGLVVDRKANLYVVQTDFGAPVLVFAPRAKRPFLRLDTQGLLPGTVCVDSRGNVFVGTTTTMLVYREGHPEPFARLNGHYGDGISDVIADREGNIYFDDYFLETGGEIGAFEARTTMPTSGPVQNLGFPVSPLYLAIDGSGDMLLAVFSSTNFIAVFQQGSTGSPTEIPVEFPTAIGFDSADTSFFSAGNGSVSQYSYPGGALIKTIRIGTNDSNFGIAVAPAPPLPPSWLP